MRRRLLTRDQRSCSEFVIARNFSKTSESDVWNRRCRIPATARPRADLLRTKLDRSAKRRDQLDDVRSGRFSARSARTRIFGTARGGPDTRTHGLKKFRARKWQPAKYRDVCVNHLTSPPLSRLLAPSVLSSILPSAASGCPDYTAVLVHAYNLPVRVLSLLTLAVPLPVLSCCHLRGEPRSRDLDAVLRYPYRYRSRSDNRLESVAYAHTAADLHVRPVSCTALVQRSWAPRAINQYNMARRRQCG